MLVSVPLVTIFWCCCRVPKSTQPRLSFTDVFRSAARFVFDPGKQVRDHPWEPPHCVTIDYLWGISSAFSIRIHCSLFYWRKLGFGDSVLPVGEYLTYFWWDFNCLCSAWSIWLLLTTSNFNFVGNSYCTIRVKNIQFKSIFEKCCRSEWQG